MINENVRSVARNTVIMMMSQVITWISSFILMMFLPKYLGSSGYGELYLAMSITAMFQVLIEFGGQYHITKEVSRVHESAPVIFINSAVSRIFLWFASIVLMILFSWIAGYSWQILLLIMILGTAKLWEGINSLLRNCYQGYELMEYPSIGAAAERIFLTAAAIPALLMGKAQVTIAIVMAISTLLNFGISSAFAKKIIRSIPKIDFEQVKSLLKQGMPYFFWSLFATIYFRVDVIMLSVMTNYNVVGWYGAAYRLFDILMFFPYIFSQALFPVLARIAGSKENSLSNVVGKSIDVILLVGIPIAVVLFSYAPQITDFLFGLKDYENSIIILQIFAVCLLLIYIDFVLGSSVLATDKQKIWSIVACVAVFLNMGLNYFIITSFQNSSGNGGTGAAIATVITELFIMFSAIYLLRGSIQNFFNFKVIVSEILGGVLMGGVFYLFKDLEFNWVVKVVIGLIIYFALILWIYSYTSKKKLFTVNNILSIKKFLGNIIVKEN